MCRKITNSMESIEMDDDLLNSLPNDDFDFEVLEISQEKYKKSQKKISILT